MKIVFLIRSLDVGGAERQLVNLAIRLNQNGYNVCIITMYSGGTFEIILEGAGVTVIQADKFGRWDVVNFFFRLINIVREIRPEILHGYMPIANILTILIKPFYPKARVVWGIRVSKMDLGKYDWLTRQAYRLEKYLARYSNLIIVNSSSGLRHLINEGYPADKLSFIPNGIDTEVFRIDREKGNRVRQQWRISGESMLIGLVGRHDPMKGHKTFIEAAALLSAQRNDVIFVCIGRESLNYTSELKKYANSKGISSRFIWNDMRNDMLAVYNALNIVTSSSSFGEGFSNTLAEAMACGIPCVATDVGDSSQIIGDTGIIVQPGNPVAMVEAWKNTLSRIEQEANIISKDVREHIVKCYSVERLVNNTMTALNRLS